MSKRGQVTTLEERVAIAEDGDLAAFCTALFEPVGTHPNHQKRGLGATLATVGSYSTSAQALYNSMSFTEFDLPEPWIKEW